MDFPERKAFEPRDDAERAICTLLIDSHEEKVINLWTRDGFIACHADRQSIAGGFDYIALTGFWQMPDGRFLAGTTFGVKCDKGLISTEVLERRF